MWVRCYGCAGLADAEVGRCPDCLAEMRRQAGSKYPKVVGGLDERAILGTTPMQVWAEAVKAMAEIGT